MAIQSKNPTTLKVVKTYAEITDTELETKLVKAESALASWRKTTLKKRIALFVKLTNYLHENKTRLGKLATLEMGKTLSDAEAEIDKSARTSKYYADNVEKFLSEEIIKTEASMSFVRFDPLGVLLAVMPWNFPYWQVYRFAIPAIIAGNVAVLKHASNVPACAYAIEKAFLDCGFPEGVFQNLALPAKRVEGLIRDPRIAAIALTGSEQAGAAVAQTAGSELKKVLLELGGSDPYIVLKDADIKLAASLGFASRIASNAGQACNAAKRFIVHKDVVKEFSDELIKHFETLVVGDPLKEETTMGPLSSEQTLNDVKKQVEASTAKGAKILFTGKVPNLPGYFFPPMILGEVKKGMSVYDEEVFAPVASIISFSDTNEAIRLANDTEYGLGATIVTKDIEKGKLMVPFIEAGSVFINAQVKSDPRTPFGGIKRSGYGRELSSYGIKEFVNIKTVWIK